MKLSSVPGVRGVPDIPPDRASDSSVAPQSWEVGVHEWPKVVMHGLFDYSTSALLFIDLQDYWLDEHGPVAIRMKRRFPSFAEYFYGRMRKVALPNCSRLLAEWRLASRRVVHVTYGSFLPAAQDMTAQRRRTINVENEADEGDYGLVRGSAQHEIVSSLRPESDELVINKNSTNAFNSSPLDQLLRNMGISSLIVCGIITNACVEMTAREASDRGYNTILVSDGTATYADDVHNSVLRNFHRSYGGVLTTDEALSQKQPRTS